MEEPNFIDEPEDGELIEGITGECDFCSYSFGKKAKYLNGNLYHLKCYIFKLKQLQK